MLSAVGYVYLAQQSSGGYGTVSLSQMLWVCGATALLCFGVWFATVREWVRLNWWDVLLFAVLFRIIGVFGFPILEDDFYRYLWDGWLTFTQGTPYNQAPAAFFSVDLEDKWSDVLDGINYPQLATVYGPTAQGVFALGYLVAPGEVWPLQLLAAVADIGVVCLLKRMAPLRWVLLYAWSPLLIKEFAFTAHIDVVGVLFLVAALHLRWQQGQRRQANADDIIHAGLISTSVGTLLAFACGIKVFALLAVPFLLQSDWRGWIAFGVTAGLISLPFGIVQAWWPAGLQAMSGDWLFNAPLYYSTAALISTAVTPNPIQPRQSLCNKNGTASTANTLMPQAKANSVPIRMLIPTV